MVMLPMATSVLVPCTVWPRALMMTNESPASASDDVGFELYDLASIGWRQRDMRMHMLDPVFVRSDSPLCTDRAGE